MRKIELLAPARNLECALAAVDHGADAVYIGAEHFGARAAAGNSIDDIAKAVQYAHLFNVRVYVTLNIILTDEELHEAERLIRQLYEIGADALIVQDMGITMLNLPPIPLHASTQMDIRSADKVRFLSDVGFRQVVLARELSLQEIADIHQVCPDTPLEVFVHGALCVSYNGQCYASQACFGRSANRGECAQFCRLPFNLLDADGKEIIHEKHLMSMKDMNQCDLLEDLLDAGATSLKIEGRLKDMAYVKNVTAAYRQRLDEIFKRRKEYGRASSGQVTCTFRPQLDKSFNRGFTHYFLQGRKPDMASLNTPKSMGERMGVVKEIHGQGIIVAGLKPFHNGDGVCFINKEGKLQGFRVNKTEGNKLFPAEPVEGLTDKTCLYRNHDHEFEKALAQQKSAERKINIVWTLRETPQGFDLQATDEDGNTAKQSIVTDKQLAQKPQADNIATQLGKLGNTPFACQEAVDIQYESNWFIPSSLLSAARRQVTGQLQQKRMESYRREEVTWQQTHHRYISESLEYNANIMNEKARQFYRQHGVKHMADAFEKDEPAKATLMTTRYCIRYNMGWCHIHQKSKSPYKEPFSLQSLDGRQFAVKFDCKLCQMRIEKP